MSERFIYVLVLFSLSDHMIRVQKTILYTFIMEGDNGRYCISKTGRMRRLPHGQHPSHMLLSSSRMIVTVTLTLHVVTPTTAMTRTLSMTSVIYRINQDILLVLTLTPKSSSSFRERFMSLRDPSYVIA